MSRIYIYNIHANLKVTQITRSVDQFKTFNVILHNFIQDYR